MFNKESRILVSEAGLRAECAPLDVARTYRRQYSTPLLPFPIDVIKITEFIPMTCYTNYQ